MLLVLDKNKKSNLLFLRIRVLYTNGCFFHEIDGSFYSSIESNELVEIQEYIYTKSWAKLEMA